MKYIIFFALLSTSFGGFSESGITAPIVSLQDMLEQEGPWSSEKPKCKSIYIIPRSRVQLSLCSGWGMTTTFERNGKVLLEESDFGDADFYYPHFVKTRNYDLLVAEIGADQSWGVRIYSISDAKIEYLGSLHINPGDKDSYDSPEVVDIIEFIDHGDKVKIRFTETHHDFDGKWEVFNIDKDAYYYELTADSIVKVENKKSD